MSPMAASRNASDDEWEYEYDDNDFEEHYVTLDLTSQVPPEQRRNQPKLKRARHDLGPLYTAEPEPLQRDNSHAAADDDSEKPAGRIQIMGLHDRQPIIRYRDRTFECDWSSAIGTDMLFTLPSEAELPPSVQPLRSNQDYDLIATSSHRLVAKPITLVPKDPNGQSSLQASGSVKPTRQSLGINTESQVIRDSVYINPARGQQASFMERLNRIKRERGERDTVPMHSRSSKDRPQTFIKSRLKEPKPTLEQSDAAGDDKEDDDGNEEENDHDDEKEEEDDDDDDDDGGGDEERASASRTTTPRKPRQRPRGKTTKAPQPDNEEEDALTMIVGDRPLPRGSGGPGSRGGPGALGGTSHLRGYTLGMTKRNKARGESWRGGRPRVSERAPREDDAEGPADSDKEPVQGSDIEMEEA